ncbi:MAG: hypothetical protein IT288_17870 [Bdellovibrionales bacterium]|nr:hypothetical protein [Bdellovibrionales bacterium]
MRTTNFGRSFLLTVLLVPVFLSSCDRQGTSTGNPLVEIRFASYSTVAQKVAANVPLDALAEPGIFSVNQLIFCFKRLRFKSALETTNPDPASDEDNIDLEVGEVTLTSSGNSLGFVRVPVGTYSRIEFDLEDHCASGLSAQVYNSQTGSPFSTNQRITIKFEGTLTIAAGSSGVDLALGSIISAADGITNNSQVRSALEGVSGSF